MNERELTDKVLKVLGVTPTPVQRVDVELLLADVLGEAETIEQLNEKIKELEAEIEDLNDSLDNYDPVDEV